VNLWENVFPWVVKAEGPDSPESNSFPLAGSLGPVPEVTVWKSVSLFVHVIVSPTLILTGLGEKALSANVDALGTMETLVPPAEVVLLPAEVVLLPAELVLLLIFALGCATTAAIA
jgi:hypothetical protein